ncbi:hypothetical protein DZC30_19370 [Comamonas testosteroni]|uniref:Uncharacterized protein n=1 Tax=Comamonas testosteroni TaxID=285 RepID=A0A373F9R9_COMTE|nr:hypothetical protein DZC30_19370 [Comamonas testosteroni]
MGDVLDFKVPVRHQTQQRLRKNLTLTAYLRTCEDGVKVRSYMSGFPQFGRMVKVLAKHIGFDLAIDGKALLGRALEQAVIAGEELAEAKAVENVDVSDLMVLTLVMEASNLYDWSVAFEDAEGLNQWDSTLISFSNWMKSAKHGEFQVVKHHVDGSEHEKLGLAIRLLCFGAENEMIGRVVGKI